MSEDTWECYAAWIEQGGMIMAMAESENLDDCSREIRHYAAVYGQDGPVIIKGPMLATFKMDMQCGEAIPISPPEYVEAFAPPSRTLGGEG